METRTNLRLLERAPLDGPRLGVPELLPERPRLDEGGEQAGVGLVGSGDVWRPEKEREELR